MSRPGLLPGCRSVGPIAVDVIEPLRALRLHVDEAASGVAADLTFGARTAAVEEARLLLVDESNPLGDWTRLAQWGSWSGSINAAGTDLAIDPARYLGSRGRSWGIPVCAWGIDWAPGCSNS
jgi:hypothetical protein